MLEKINLFEARTNGYWHYRIPGIVVTPGGAVLVTTEARKGRGGDWDPIDQLMRRSTDGGRTWDAPRVFADHCAYGEGPMNNLALISDPPAKAVHAVYNYDYVRMFYRRSDDDGATFSPPVDITSVLEPFHKITPSLDAFRREYPWRVIAAGPGHGTMLRNGRLIVPLWMSDGSGTEFTKAKKLGHHPNVVTSVYSDDHGRTWQPGEIIRDERGRWVHIGETVMVELSDGRVLFNSRNQGEQHRRLISISPDGARDWSPPRFDEALLEPVCMASLIRHSWPSKGKPGRVIFANPDNLEPTATGTAQDTYRDRKRVTIKLSYDDCATWPVSKVLEEGPSGYTDLAVLPDGTILCFYERGAVEKMCDTRWLALARFDLEWLTDGKDRG